MRPWLHFLLYLFANCWATPGRLRTSFKQWRIKPKPACPVIQPGIFRARTLSEFTPANLTILFPGGLASEFEILWFCHSFVLLAFASVLLVLKFSEALCYFFPIFFGQKQFLSGSNPQDWKVSPTNDLLTWLIPWVPAGNEPTEQSYQHPKWNCQIQGCDTK